MNKIDQALKLMEQAYESMKVFEQAYKLLKEYRQDSNVQSSLPSIAPEATVLTKTAIELDTDFIKAAVVGDQWPVAANPTAICNKHKNEDKMQRAKGVVELMIETDLAGKKFLDFGCWEGHMAYHAAKQTDLSVGYDIRERNWPVVGNANNNFEPTSNLILTTSWEEMVKNGPYDVILIFDVLDHANVKDGLDAPGELLKKINEELLAPDGTIYMRCHPWISRHGTHIYQEVNKAYVHLVLTDDELLSLGMNMGEPTHKVIAPIMTYRKWITNAGLHLENERVIREPMEPFFKTPAISKRIIENCQMKDGNGQLMFPEFQTTIAFIDFILRKSPNGV